MEVISDPGKKVYLVRDIDVGFNSGDVRQFTLFDTDEFTVTAETVMLTIYPRQEDLSLVKDGKPERITIFRSAVSWTSERERDLVVSEEPEDVGKKVVIT